MRIKNYDNDNEIIHLEINELELRAMRGALVCIPIWASENDIPSITGIALNDFMDVRKNIVTVIRKIDRTK